MRYATEMFIHFVYSIELSYHDLLDTEKKLMSDMDELMRSNGAEFIHFEPLGDTLQAQCVFSRYEKELFHKICRGVTSYLGDKVEARILFVDKNLDSLSLYSISNNEWKESTVDIPVAGPIGESLKKDTFKNN